MKRRIQKKSIVEIGLIQAAASSNFSVNLAKTISQIKSAASKGAQIVCLQELFAFQYFPQTRSQKYFECADSRHAELIKKTFSKLARELNVVILAPFFEKTERGDYFNSAFIINVNGAVLGTYRKMHIPDDSGFYEKYYFKNGNLGFKVFKTKYAKIGVLICWDQWFPEAARAVALKGAEIIFYPTAIGWDIRRKDSELLKEREAWLTIQRSHAIANGIFVASVNRVGREGNLKFWGNSFVSDPLGEVISKAGESKEQNLIASCDLSQIRKARAAWPFMRDRRTDAYLTK